MTRTHELEDRLSSDCGVSVGRDESSNTSLNTTKLRERNFVDGVNCQHRRVWRDCSSFKAQSHAYDISLDRNSHIILGAIEVETVTLTLSPPFYPAQSRGITRRTLRRQEPHTLYVGKWPIGLHVRLRVEDSSK